VSPLKSRPLPPEKAQEVERRVARTLARYDRGEPLTDHEQLIAYWLRHGEGCHACGAGGPAGIAVAVRSPDAPDER
jgi:hypothetical protein